METGLNKTYYAESLKQCSKNPCFFGDYMGFVLSNIFFGLPEALINPVMKLVGLVIKIVEPTL